MTSFSSKQRIDNLFIYFLHTRKSSHHQFPKKGYYYKTFPPSENKNPTLPYFLCFSKIQGCVSSRACDVAFLASVLILMESPLPGMFSPSVLVHLGCCNKTPQTGWFMNRNLLLMALEPGKLRAGCHHGWGMVLFWGTDFSSCPHMVDLCGVSFIRALIPFMRASPS